MPNHNPMPSRNPTPQRSLNELLRELEHLRENPPENKSQGRVIPRGHSLTESPLQSEIDASLAGREHELAPEGTSQEIWLSENRPTLYYFRQMGSFVVTYHDGHPAIAFHYLYASVWETVILRFPDPNFRTEDALLLAMAIVSGDLLVLRYGELIPHNHKDDFNFLPEFSPMAVEGLRTKIESLEASQESIIRYNAREQAKLHNELESMKSKDAANRAEINAWQESSSNWKFVAILAIVLLLVTCALPWLMAFWSSDKNSPEKTARLGMWHTTPPAYLAKGAAIGPLGTPETRR